MDNKKKMIRYLNVAIIATMITILLGIGFIKQAQSSIYNEQINFLEEISLKSAKNVEEQIMGYISAVNVASTFIGEYESIDLSRIMPLLAQEANKSLFKRMGIILPNGAAITTDGKEFDLSDRDYFQRAMKGEKVASNSLVDKDDGVLINVFAAPIIHKGEIQGVTFATKTQEELSDVLKIQSFNGKGYSYIINTLGEPIVKTNHPNSIGEYQNLFTSFEEHGMNFDEMKQLKKDIKNEKTGMLNFDRDGENQQLCYTKIGINDWYIVSEVATHEISAESDKLITNLIILMVLIVIATAAISLWIVNVFRMNAEKLKRMAFSDSLTGYANWNKFSIDVKNILNESKDQKFAIIALDINKFKIINDMFGTRVADDTLRHVATTIEKSLHQEECGARTGSDVFHLLLKYENDDILINRIHTIKNEIKDFIEGYKIEIFVGIYIFEDRTIDIKVLCDRANISRKIAKKKNELYYNFFRNENRLELIHEKEIENIMADAIENSEFEVYLQPKYCLKSNQIIGAEALVRWHSSQYMTLFPNEFIPIFEKNGFIRKLDLYMFEKICVLIHRWQQESNQLSNLSLSVNISRVHLSDQSLSEKLLGIANHHQVDPKRIEIELTESALFLDIKKMIEIMDRIKKAGFQLSIDDFGSGYSSLSALKDLPADFVKIDKSFLDDSVNDERGKHIIQSMIAMIKGLGLQTIAEGVETKDQLEFLRSVNCDIVQGYYYSKAIPIDKFEELVLKQDKE